MIKTPFFTNSRRVVTELKEGQLILQCHPPDLLLVLATPVSDPLLPVSLPSSLLPLPDSHTNLKGLLQMIISAWTVNSTPHPENLCFEVASSAAYCGEFLPVFSELQVTFGVDRRRDPEPVAGLAGASA